MFLAVWLKAIAFNSSALASLNAKPVTGAHAHGGF